MARWVKIPGKMLVFACVLDQVDALLTIGAGLSVQSPFTNRSFRGDSECIQSRQYMLSDMGDPFTLLKATPFNLDNIHTQPALGLPRVAEVALGEGGHT